MPKRKNANLTLEKHLTKVFSSTANPGSFGGVDSVWRAVNTDGNKRHISKSRVAKWLSNKRSYTLHKQPRRKFSRRKVIVSGMNSQWQADLIDMSKHAKENKGYKFLLTVIDIFSKVAYAKALKRKDAESVTNAFESILLDSKQVVPYTLQTDKGKEFLNSTFKKWCADNGIKLVTSEDDIMKSQIVERFNRTLKNKMYRLFAFNKSVEWYSNLADLLISYNNSYHRSIKMTPNQVTIQNENEIFHTMYPPPAVVSAKGDVSGMKVGDYVRLLNPPTVFKKGYAPQWTKEVFKIRLKIMSTPVVMFKVEDQTGEHVEGHFYRSELQKVDKPKGFKIENVIESKGDKHYVRFEDRGYKYDKWLTAKDLKAFHFKL